MRALALAVLILAGAAFPADATDQALPPPNGPETPRVEPISEEGGLYRQEWFLLSFLNLKEDFAEARAAGKRFAVIFEQRGCPYCIKLHTEVLSQRYINEYVRQNFAILQLDLWGSRDKSFPVSVALPPGATVWQTWDLHDWAQRQRGGAKVASGRQWATARYDSTRSTETWAGTLQVAFAIDVDGSSPADAAQAWVDANQAVWQPWVDAALA